MMRTEAGRRAELRVPHFDHCAGMRGPNPCDCGVNAAIHAVEAEAWGVGFTEGTKAIPLALAADTADDEEAALAYAALQEAIRHGTESVTIQAPLARYLAARLMDTPR